MKFLTASRMMLLTGTLLLGTQNVSAQNRNSLGSFQQGGFGADTQRGFGASGQFGGQRQQGQFGLGRAGGRGQSRNQGRQGGNFGSGQDYFVGSDAQQVRRQRNSSNQGQRPRAMIDYSLENLNDMRGASRQSSSGNTKSPVRVQLRPLFTIPQLSASQLTARASTQLRKALPTTVAGAQISVSDGTATIAGTVRSEYDKQLVARMLSLQPGISQVENRLTIESGREAPLLFPAR